MQYPIGHTAVNADDFDGAPLEDYNVLVLPQAFGLNRAISGGTLDDLKSWVRSGGTIVAIGSSAEWAFENIASGDDDEDDEEEEEDDDRADPSELS